MAVPSNADLRAGQITRPPTPALFLDRDGVINMDTGFVHRSDDVVFVEGIFDLVGFAVRHLGWPVVVVTNQSGIGRGKYDEAAYQRLCVWLHEEFSRRGAPLARIYHCPHHPEHGTGDYKRDHPWRKPNPGMLLQAAADLSIDLAASVLIGDRGSDMAAGAAAGVGLLVALDRSAGAKSYPGAHVIVADLAAARSLLEAKAVCRF